MGELGTPPGRAARTSSRAAFAALLLLLALLFAGAAAGAKLKAPVPVSPAGGAVAATMPTFSWKPVAGAEEYEFQIAADARFSSPVLGHGKDDFRTKNTRATVTLTAPNGTYWWHVRAIGRNGIVSAWSPGESFGKRWGTATTLVSPVGGDQVVYPTTPLEFSWSAVPGARSYLVSVATDPSLGSLVSLNGSPRPVETTATTLTPVAALAPGTYYWGVTPVDAEGNHGDPSAVASFNWTWPSTTTPRLTDLVTSPELFDPRFSWDPVPGAARYDVEINSSVDFAPGSKVCCGGTTINTSLSPTLVFKDDAYYWRVRAIDIDGHAGVWNCYGDLTCQSPAPFTKTFDNVPPVTAPSIKNLRMRDNAADPGVDTDPVSPGYQTQVPIVSWNPVPGSSSYQVDVTRFDGSSCVWSAGMQDHWTNNIALTSWTPLGTHWNLVKPYPDPHPVATELLSQLSPGRYCVRVRARSDRAFGEEVYGDYTYLDPDGLGWAFEWAGYPSGGACSPSCAPGYLGAGDYLEPQSGTTSTQTPLFTWRPVAGAGSYFVIVAKDASFTNVVDYAFTQIPAYAPRSTFTPTTYPDETTLYYWAVLPEAGFDGTGGEGDPLLGAPQASTSARRRRRRSSPRAGTSSRTSRRSSGLRSRVRARTGCRSRRTRAGAPIDDMTTDSTAYSSNTTYPADTVLYWRVRANDENNVGLSWSAVGTFQKRLDAPWEAPGTPRRVTSFRRGPGISYPAQSRTTSRSTCRTARIATSRASAQPPLRPS